ncbi:PrgI family protein [Micromonospora sp. Llam7]|nr:PrgI family protein [Micromonospora tarapacensis]
MPADIGAPDKIAWGLSFRQLAIIGTVAGAGWLLYSNFGPLLPPMAWVIAAIPIAAVTIVVALGKRDGLPLDVWLRHGLALRRVPKLQTPGRTRTGQPLVDTTAPPMVPAPLRIAATTIAADGTLTVDGAARCVIACGTTNVALRTGQEQAALLSGFGQWLNALTGPAQIVVAAQRHDLTPYAQAVLDNTARLPHEALRRAADDYAAFLLELDTTRDPLRRQVLAVIAQGPTREATVRTFGALGVSAEPLDGGALTAALASAVDPYQPPVPGPRAVPGVPITTRRNP